jgi:hypothetical protein
VVAHTAYSSDSQEDVIGASSGRICPFLLDFPAKYMTIITEKIDMLSLSVIALHGTILRVNAKVD